MGLFDEMTLITDHLFLTSIGGMSRENCVKNGITFVISATLNSRKPNLADIERLELTIDDAPQANISQYFDLVSDRIHEVSLFGGITAVYCVAGVSRSTSLVLAYLMKYLKMSLHCAFNFVHQRRPVIRPNNGFFQQLIEYEKKVLGASSVNMMVVHKFGQTLIIPNFFEIEHRRLIILEAIRAKGRSKRSRSYFCPRV